MIKNVGGERQATRAAHDGDFLPDAKLAVARAGSQGEVQVDVVRHKKVEAAVAIIVQESTARPEARSGDGQPSLCGNLLKAGIAQVAVEPVVAVVGNQKVCAAVVVKVAGADPLCPSLVIEPTLLPGKDKVSFSIVPVEMG